MKILPNQRTVIVGTSGSGKSYYAKKLIKKLVLAGQRVIVYDLKQEYGGKYAVDPVNLSNYTTYIAHDARGLEEGLEGRDGRLIVIQPNMLHGGSSLNINFNRCCEYIYGCHNLVFVVDEIQALQTKQKILPSLKAIVVQKRAHGLGFIGVSQRFSSINNDILSQCNNILSFSQHHPSDLKVLADYFSGVRVPCNDCGGKGCNECGGSGLVDSEKYAMLVREKFFRDNHLFLWYTDNGEVKIMKSPM